jgi:hypothetical protein
MDNKIRVFISYSHKDRGLVEKLDEIIRNAGMIPLWSQNLVPSQGFDENIMIFIEYANVFMPVLSKNSSHWVHQEIGFAKAHRIQIFPLTTDEIYPQGMLQMIQATKISTNFKNIEEQLKSEVFRKISFQENSRAVFRRAAYVEERATMMKEYAHNLTLFNEYGIVRQRGGLSSFHIPIDEINDPKWSDRYFPEKRGKNHKYCQLGERKALQEHAVREGCKLIINPHYATEGRSELARRTRLQELIDFLKFIPDGKVTVAVQRKPTDIESLTIVGNWFLAESVSFKMGDGFTNTFFTRNATEVSKRIDEFDHELKVLLNRLGWTEENSKSNAIAELNEILNSNY